VVLDYLFLDASFFRIHPGSPAEPVLAGWGITTDGKPVFVGLAPGAGESTDAWADFLTDLRDRGLGCPLLVISDGAAGLIAAIEQVLPAALRQRCLIHRLRNILVKIPAGMQAEIRDGYWACFDTAEVNTGPGPRLVELVDARLTAFAERYGTTYPAAMKIVLTDREGLTAYLRFPAEHHHRIRHSNFIERTFGETRRRAKVIGRFPGETSCISIAWAVLDRASRGWRGLAMTPAGLRQLQDLRRSLLQPPRQLRPQHNQDCPNNTTETASATASHQPPKPEPSSASFTPDSGRHHRHPSNTHGGLRSTDDPKLSRREDQRRGRHRARADGDDTGPLARGRINQRSRRCDRDHANNGTQGDHHTGSGGAPTTTLQHHTKNGPMPADMSAIKKLTASKAVRSHLDPIGLVIGPTAPHPIIYSTAKGPRRSISVTAASIRYFAIT
jgi:hypothetical protein